MRRGWWFAAAAVGIVGVAMMAMVAASASGGTARVDVNGRPFVLAGHPSVGALLTRAHELPRTGRLFDASHSRVLDPAWAPGEVWLDGRLVALEHIVRAGDRVWSVAGQDSVEPTNLDLAVTHSAGGAPPDVERDLWTPSHDGLEVDVVGAVSGEVVERSALRAPQLGGAMPGMVVALSFDDGPDPRYTPRVLEVLRQAGVHATFCEVGYEMRAFPNLVRAVVSDGNVLCDHTEHHPRLDQLPRASIDTEIGGPAEFAASLVGQRPAFLRAPYGALNAAVLDSAHRQGLRVLGWSVDPSDYLRPPPATIAARVLGAVHPGAIVLLHDGGGDRTNTIAALPTIISGLKARGYTIVTPVA
jgi:peptidoglycan/xylan/chitin deacetylase (PgdA/CDA1 family)